MEEYCGTVTPLYFWIWAKYDASCINLIKDLVDKEATGLAPLLLLYSKAELDTLKAHQEAREKAKSDRAVESQAAEMEVDTTSTRIHINRTIAKEVNAAVSVRLGKRGSSTPPPKQTARIVSKPPHPQRPTSNPKGKDKGKGKN
ncbi:unnamed protein product, partial [Discosporangium mesarthrocarpum]